MPTPSNTAIHGPEDPQDGSDHDEDAADGSQNPNVEQHSQDQQNYTENNH